MMKSVYDTKPIAPMMMIYRVIAVILISAFLTLVTFRLASSFFSTNSYNVTVLLELGECRTLIDLRNMHNNNGTLECL